MAETGSNVYWTENKCFKVQRARFKGQGSKGDDLMVNTYYCVLSHDIYVLICPYMSLYALPLLTFSRDSVSFS